MQKKAFTLIELLVVISIIALLLAVLMPALTRAKDQARQVVCQANLRQLSVGMEIYVNEHNDRIPMPFDETAGPPGSYKQWKPPWYVLVGAEIGWKPRSVYGVELNKRNVIHCPSVTGTRGNPSPYISDWGTSHYTSSRYNANLKLAWITSPSKYVFLADSCPAYFTFNPSMVFPDLIWPWELIVHRHSGDRATNQLFFDSHIEVITKDELYQRGIDAFMPRKTMRLTP